VISFRAATILFAVLPTLISCTPELQPERNRADLIVDSAIAYHGGERYEYVDLSFNFRGREYGARREGGEFAYMNAYRDSLGLHTRWLNNTGYRQELNGTAVGVTPKDSAARAASVNSVIYFALLPGMLGTSAAKKQYLGKEEIEGEFYHKVKVTFNQEGGGEDYDDVFLYWFSVDTYTMDYLAYSYLEDEGGTRFRKAINRRRVNGLVFQDYINFRGPAPDSLDFISQLFKDGALDTLSMIEVINLRVDPILSTSN
jgi:hypothetical protein